MMHMPFNAWLKLLLLSGTIAMAGTASAEIYLPRTRVHFQCRFPDGSYTEYKQREKWFFYAEPFAHAQTTAPLDSEMKYVDPGGKKHLYVGTSDDQCIGVGKRAGRLFFSDGFENAKGQFVHFNPANQVKNVPAPDWERFPRGIPAKPDRTPEIRAFMEQEHLYADPQRQIVPMASDQTLLYELPLTALDHPTVPSNTVLYVYQSISTDYGKTWSMPVITKDAKLFEIGRLLTAQSWSAAVKTIVKDAALR